MSYSSINEFAEAITSALEPELRKYDKQYDDANVIGGHDVLLSKAKDAIDELKIKRNYAATNYSDEQILADMESYIGILKKVTLFYYGKIGAYSELYHYENTVHRSWPHEDELWYGVHPFVKILGV